MEKTLKEVIANPGDIFSHLAENCLRYNWRNYLKQHQKERLLGRFGFYLEADEFPVSTSELAEHGFAPTYDHSTGGYLDWPTKSGFVGNWGSEDVEPYADMGEALDAGLEAMLEEWDAQYVLDIFLSPDRCPLKECREAAELMRLERNPQ